MCYFLRHVVLCPHWCSSDNGYDIRYNNSEGGKDIDFQIDDSERPSFSC